MGNAKTTEFLKECLADALIKLLKTKPIEKITVPEICKCQSGFCMESVMEILARELGIPFEEVLKNQNGKIVVGKAKNKR